MRGTQGTHEHVPWDVSGSEFPGWRARSAVFLVHAESLWQATGGPTVGECAGRLALRKRMLSHPMYERPVTKRTRVPHPNRHKSSE